MFPELDRKRFVVLLDAEVFMRVIVVLLGSKTLVEEKAKFDFRM